MKQLVAAWVMALVVVMSAMGVAWAQEGPEVEPLRQWTVPLSLSPFSAEFVVGEEDTVWMMGRDDGEDPRCIVAAMADEGVVGLDVAFEYRPTRCLAMSPVDDGGIVLRGEYRPVGVDEMVGFMAAIDQDGEIRWRLDDQDVFDDGLSGDYDGASAVIAVVDGDGASGRALSLLAIEESSGGQRRTQWRWMAVDIASGELDGDLSGGVWPTEGEPAATQGRGDEVWLRDNTGAVGVWTVGESAYRPVESAPSPGGDWVDMEVNGDGVWLLWSDVEELEAGIVEVDGEGSQQVARWSPQGDGQWFGEPRQLWAGVEGFAILHRPPAQPGHLRWQVMGDMEEGYFSPWTQWVQDEPVSLVPLEEGWLLIAVDGASAQVWEYAIELAAHEPGEASSGCSATGDSGGPGGLFWAVAFVLGLGVGRN